MSAIHTTEATGTKRPGRRVKWRTPHSFAADAAYAAVRDYQASRPETLRKRTRILGHVLPSVDGKGTRKTSRPRRK